MASQAELDFLISEYQRLSALPQKTKDVINSLNKLAENIGEVSADIEIEKKFGSSIKEKIKIPVRGTRGPPVLDLLYELTNGDLVLVEAKYDMSLRGRSNQTIFAADDVAGSGAVEKITLKKEIEQLEGPWVQARRKELRKYDKKLANKLDQAIQNDKLKVFEVRAVKVTTPDGSITIESQITDETKKVKDYFKTGRQPITDAERAIDRGIAKKEAFTTIDHEAALVKSEKLKKEAKNAQRVLEREERKYDTLERKVKAFKKPETKKKYELALESQKQKVAEAKEKFEAIKKAAQEASEETETLQKSLRGVRKEQTARIAERRIAGLAKMAEKTATVKPGAIAGEGSNIYLDRGNLRRGVENNVKIEQAVTLADKGVHILEGELKVSKVIRIYSFTKNIGKFAVFLFIPTTLLDVFIEFVLRYTEWLIDRWYREEREEKAEWARVLNFLLGNMQVLRTPFKSYYVAGHRSLVERSINSNLGDPKYDKNFLYWVNKWDKDKRSPGFVYPVIQVKNLLRQERTEVFENAEYNLPNVRYFLRENIDISFTEDSLEINNVRLVIANTTTTYEANDDKNMFTNGEPSDRDDFSNAAAYESITSVRSSNIKIRYAIPTPVITPFDIVLFKCRNLIAEIMRFLSRYDENVVIENPRDESTGLLKNTYWYEGYTFVKPINTEKVHFCLKTLFFITDSLQLHTPVENDYDKDDRSHYFSKGHDRRFHILFDILTASPKNSHICQVARYLWSLVPNMDEKWLRKPIDPELTYLTTDVLYDMAMEIQDDVLRIWKDIKDDNKQRSLLYEYRGTIDPD